MRALIPAILSTMILLSASKAEAIVWRVWYNDLGRPTDFSQTSDRTPFTAPMESAPAKFNSRTRC